MTIDRDTHGTEWQLLAEFESPDAPGREEQLISLIDSAVDALDFFSAHLVQLRQVLIDAVEKTTRPAASGLPGSPIIIRVFASSTDPGDWPQSAPSTRTGTSIQGWGYFLINRWSASSEIRDVHQGVVELYLYPEGGIGRVTPPHSPDPELLQ